MTLASAISLVLLAAAIVRAEPQLQVVSPENGAVVNAGSALTIVVKAASAFQSVSIAGEGPFALSTGLSAPPYEYSYTIPADFTPGRYRFKAAGVTASGETVYSAPVEVDIERSDDARKLQSEWLSLTFVDEKDLPLQIWGTFADGSKIDLTRSTRLTYTSDRPAVAAVSNEGRVTAVSSGKAKITVKYGNKTIIVPVVITQSLPGETLLGSKKELP